MALIPLAGKEKKGDLIISRKAAPNLAKWNQKSKELRSDASTGAAAGAKASSGASAAAEKAKQPVLAQARSSPAVELVLTSLHSLRSRSRALNNSRLRSPAPNLRRQLPARLPPPLLSTIPSSSTATRSLSSVCSASASSRASTS